MNIFHIRKMVVDDFSFAVRLTDTMRWNLVDEDFKFMLSLEPEGCFVLLNNSERIGIATTISFGSIGWLGNVIVDEKNRGQGGGTILVKHCIAYLKKKSVKTIGLYGYLNRIPFYVKQGFRCDSEFVVLKRKKGHILSAGINLSRAQTNYREFKRGYLEHLIKLDEKCFCAFRRKMLEPLLFNSNNLCYLFEESGNVLGFAVAKIYDELAEIGPLVCMNGHEDIVINLLLLILKNLDGLEVILCIPEKEWALFNILKKLEFSEDFRLVRMFNGPPLVSDCIYFAESLERG